MQDYDRWAADYARHRRAHPGVVRGLAGALSESSTALDVGCGTGNYLLALHDATGGALWGVEPSGEMRARAAERAPRAMLVGGRAERLPVLDAAFDLVYSVDVIHHVADRAAYFREAMRALKPGGWVCTVTDSEDMIRRRQPQSVYFPETIEPELRRYPSIGALFALMAEAGFSDAREEAVEFGYSVADARPYRDKAFSSLHLIPDEAFERGLRRMEDDLRAGPIAGVARYALVWGRRRIAGSDRHRPRASPTARRTPHARRKTRSGADRHGRGARRPDRPRLRAWPTARAAPRPPARA